MKSGCFEIKFSGFALTFCNWYLQIYGIVELKGIQPIVWVVRLVSC